MPSAVGKDKTPPGKSVPKTGKNEGGDDEGAEQQSDSKLSAVGKRALSGFKSRYGEEDGEDKYYKALNNGTLDKSTHLSNAVGVSKGKGN